MLATALRVAGYAVVAVGNGRQSLEDLRRNLALILLDMLMPECDGWGLLRARYRDPAMAGVPVFVSTAIGVACPEWAASVGADGFLHKPARTWL